MTVYRSKYGSFEPLSARQEAEKIIRRHFPTEDGLWCACCLTFAKIRVKAYECEPVVYARGLLKKVEEYE